MSRRSLKMLVLALAAMAAPGQSGAQAPRFPLQAKQSDTIGSQWDMATSVVLSENGRLDADTRLSNGRKPYMGFVGGVIVGLKDEAGNVLWYSELHKFGIDGPGPFEKTKVRTVHWHEQVPVDVLRKARRIVIAHAHTPDNRFLERILREVKDLLGKR